MKKRRSNSSFFHNILHNISQVSVVKLHIHLLNVVARFIFSSILQIWYIEFRISRSISESSLNSAISRVDCISLFEVICPFTFTPEFLKCILLWLKLVECSAGNKVLLKIANRMAKSVEFDETAHSKALNRLGTITNKCDIFILFVVCGQGCRFDNKPSFYGQPLRGRHQASLTNRSRLDTKCLSASDRWTPNESQRQKTYLHTCAPCFLRRFRSTCAFAQSDQNLHRAHFGWSKCI